MDIRDLNSTVLTEQLSLVLIGRVIMERDFNIEAFKKTLMHVWGVSKRLIIRLIGPNLFYFQFLH